MIDIHCHILPGLDDGADDPEESLAMCRLSLEEGVRGIFATPHLFHGMFATDRDTILNTHARVRDLLDSEAIPLKLYVGADLHLVPDVFEKMKNGEGVTLNHGRYFLLEPPAPVLPPNLSEIVFNLVSEGWIPIITHPERNEAFLRNGEILLDLLRRGALCQITAMSLTGAFGKECEWFARALVETGGAHFIASDAHSTGWRNPALLPARRVAEKLIGVDAARRLVQDNPEAVLSGGTIPRVDVEGLPRRRRFWFF